MKRLYFQKFILLVAVVFGFNSAVFAACNPTGTISGSASACIGTTGTLSESVTGGTWSSSTTAVATIDAATGIYTGVTAGTAVITYNVATPCTALATFTVTINTNPSALGNITIPFCSGIPATVTSSPAGGTWSVSNAGVASIDAGGVITGSAAGTTTVTYKLATGCIAQKTATFNLGAKVITGTTALLCTSKTISLSDPVPGGLWTSSNSNATVDSFGHVTGVAAGTPYITYKITAGGCFTTYQITVSTQPAPITGPSSLCVGSSVSLFNTSTGGTWASSDHFVTTVSTSGFVTGVIAGSSTISYTLPGGCSSTRNLVTNPLPDRTLVSSTNASALQPAGIVLCQGDTTFLSTIETGGLWSSSNTSIVRAGSTGGRTRGIAAGVATVKYTFTTTGCAAVFNTTVNSTPTAYSVTGGGGFCADVSGAHVTLSNSDPGVQYDLYSAASATPVATQFGASAGLDFGIQGVGTYTAIATNPSGCKAAMTGTTNVTLNPLPLTFNLSATNGDAYCFGTAGARLRLDSSQVGVTYQVYNSSNVATGPSVTGTGAGGPTFDLNSNYTAGTYTVIGTNTTTGCKAIMNGVETIIVTPAPSVYPVISSSASTAYCAGGSGVDVSVLNSDPGITYTLYRGGSFVTAVDASGVGTLSFGNQAVAGNYTVIAADSAAGGCYSNMSGSVTVVVNPVPVARAVTGGGAYCSAAPDVHIRLGFSDGGVNYTLYNTATPTVSLTTLSGSSSALDFGVVITPGCYLVKGVNGLGCETTMSGTACVTVNSSPLNQTVTGGGAYCSGDTGVHIFTGSEAGVRYQLNRNGIALGLAKSGALATTLDFGPLTNPGTYSVTGTNIISGCATTMSNTKVVSINPLPDQHIVTGGGGYCFGDLAGVNVLLTDKSDTGINYVLSGNGIPQATLAGTNDTLVFPAIVLPGTYTIVAENANTHCIQNMNGSAIVTVNPLPVNYKVTGGGTACAGGLGLPLGDSLSAIGVQYTVLDSGAATTHVLGGTGTALNFGLFGTGSYTIQAKNMATGCINVGANTDINIHSLPAQYIVSGSAHFCSSDSGSHVMLSFADSGISYQLYNGTTAVGTAVAGNAAALDFGLQTAGGTYTVIATDTLTHCTAATTTSAILTVTPAPAVFAVTLDGTSHCESDMTGIKMNLGGSQLGTDYEVFNRSGASDGLFAGTGLPIYLGAHVDSGYYKVVATDVTTGCGVTMPDSVLITIRPSNPVSDTIYTFGSTDTVCSSSPVTFKGTTINSGTMPVFVWKVNGIIVGHDSMLTYPPLNGDVVTATLKSNIDCPLPALALSNAITMTVNPLALPTAVVTTAKTSVCPGSSVTFTAAVTLPGTTPHYAWIMNGKPVGTDAATYTVIPADTANVFVQYTSSYACASSSYIISNTETITLNEAVLPALSIYAVTSTSVVKGGAVTLRADVANKGTFTYQWYVHGVAVAFETNPTFTYNYTVDQEDVKCVVTSHSSCDSITTSKSILISVRDNTGVKNVTANGDVKIVPNPSKGTFTVKGTLGNTADEAVTLELTNMMGQVVYSNQVISHSGSINEQVQVTGNLASGMYILTLRSASDNEVFHVVIEK